MFARLLFLVLAGFSCQMRLAAAEVPSGQLAFESLPHARFEFAGPVGQRIRANVDQWLLCAPQANPGMLEMFRLRDRQPAPQLVPWAGEFVGKYLISAVQALRMSDDPRLGEQVSNVVAGLIATQAEDGYLGPFPKPERLLGNWDLWGHYHAIEALLLWQEHSGDPAALAAARKAGDLVCRTFLDTGTRALDAGSPEMNLSILTAMARLYRATGEPRYLRMAREVELDWERAGDYLRAGLDGREFYQCPKPRWESLHDLQGLVELWRITGDPKYRDAFVHHWRSIRRWDRRNTGGFSSGEQATGNPYAPTAIETCCTVAWMAITIDYLKLTGDVRVADDLELATLNAGLGAQQASGRWFTYNTPMDGVREASAHAIVFQARAGTPELNCCSVNGPRVPGMLSDWALMIAGDALVLNWLGAANYQARLADGATVRISSREDAWRSGRAEIRVETTAKRALTLHLRIPAWAAAPQLRLNGRILPAAAAGSYVSIQRQWRARDRLEFRCELPVRFVAGANEAAGKVSLYRGPLLLAYDQQQNAMDEDAIPLIDLPQLPGARVIPTQARGEPWLMAEVPTADHRALRLVNFASAGWAGTHYRSWLAAADSPPAPAFTELPADGAPVSPGQVQFQWRESHGEGVSPALPMRRDYRLEFATNAAFSPILLTTSCPATNRVLLNTTELAGPAGDFPASLYWRVASLGPRGETVPDVPPAHFIVEATRTP